ncbi:MAG: phosphopyruvate hydratase [Candidatus Levybacteria bacterium]|nr:phosphopyruvate hydratase [Candidatus Levybacteria bacterium]
MKIQHLSAREILDSRGIPTVEVILATDTDLSVSASCPSGKSVGTYEAVELRDSDQSRFLGFGVRRAMENIERIITPSLIGMDVTSQGEIDKKMIALDGTPNKGKLGANAILPVSMAVAKAAAAQKRMPLYQYLRQFVKLQAPMKVPLPLFNIINGGLHAGKNLDMQEFIILPASFKSYSDSVQLGFVVYHKLKNLLLAKNLSTLVGDEGGFAPMLAGNEDALELIAEAISQTNSRLGYDIFLGIDAAASTFYDGKTYALKERKRLLTNSDLVSEYSMLIKKYHILYLEDPFAEDDWDGWTALKAQVDNTIVTGDDLIATNLLRLSTAIKKKAISGIIIKPNQIGTVIESLAVVEAAREAGIKIIVSHRSGETNDDFIADFAVAVSADYCKFGAPVRGERVAKYNRLLQIEKELKQ